MNIRAVETLLITTVIGKKIVWHDRVDSTNTTLRSMAAEGAMEGTVVGAEAQSAGRGRFHREWISTPGENLLFSVLLFPPFPEEQIPLLNFLASLSVASAVGSYPGLRAQLRWPNDVYIDGKKVCGILAERTGTAVVLGIGVNVNQSTFPDGVPNATSLATSSGYQLERDRLLHILLRELDDQYARALREGFNGIMNDWRALCDMHGSHLSLRSGSDVITGVVEGIDDDGALLIRDDRGIDHRCFAGDATLHV
jgi:BirA family biotin operon repressor/biotin-[acetyl-CoA-carboxylase] ligase